MVIKLLTLDFLSDSGTTAMTDRQWASLFLGDESYGRNTGYYLLLDAIRDIFERGDKRKNAVNLIFSGEKNPDVLSDGLFLQNIEAKKSIRKTITLASQMYSTQVQMSIGLMPRRYWLAEISHDSATQSKLNLWAMQHTLVFWIP